MQIIHAGLQRCKFVISHHCSDMKASLQLILEKTTKSFEDTINLSINKMCHSSEMDVSTDENEERYTIDKENDDRQFNSTMQFHDLFWNLDDSLDYRIRSYPCSLALQCCHICPPHFDSNLHNMNGDQTIFNLIGSKDLFKISFWGIAKTSIKLSSLLCSGKLMLGVGSLILLHSSNKCELFFSQIIIMQTTQIQMKTMTCNPYSCLQTMKQYSELSKVMWYYFLMLTSDKILVMALDEYHTGSWTLVMLAILVAFIDPPLLISLRG